MDYTNRYVHYGYMCNGYFNNRFIDLQILGHFEFLPFLPKNGRVESISTVSVITR